MLDVPIDGFYIFVRIDDYSSELEQGENMTEPRYMKDRVPTHLRRAKYQVAIARGMDVATATRIREWSINKFIDILSNHPRRTGGNRRKVSKQ